LSTIEFRVTLWHGARATAQIATQASQIAAKAAKAWRGKK
jgi:hypothetical protein